MRSRKLIFLAVLVISIGCEDVVEDPAPKGVIAEGLNNTEITEGLVTAAYHALSGNVESIRSAFVGPVTNWVMDVRSDDAYTGGEGAAVLEYSGLPQMERGTIFPADVDGDNLSIPLDKWRNNYYAIARVNRAINSILALEDDEYPKDVRLAEMYLLRGHFHFDLKRTFDQIVYLDENTDPFSASNTDFSSGELWDLIEGDFQKAFDGLPTSQGEDIGRMNKYIAAAYLCKLQLETGQYTEAISNADFVIAGPYGLLIEFEDLATIPSENGLESVFTIQFSRGNVALGGQIFPNHNWNNLLNAPRGAYGGDGFYLGSQDLANVFRTDINGLPLFDTYNDTNVGGSEFNGNLDPRIDFTFGRVGIPWKQSGVYDASWIRSAVDFPNGRSGKKHIVDANDPAINDDTTFPWAASGLNFHVIRYAEVLLWKAEALIESGGSLDQARDLINQVRARAAGSTPVQRIDGTGDAANYVIGEYPNNATWTQDYARQALRFERRLELAMEGHRMYDLIRWGVAEQVMDDYFEIESTRSPHLQGQSLDFNGSQIYLPIPQEEIDLAPQLFTQNPGY